MIIPGILTQGFGILLNVRPVTKKILSDLVREDTGLPLLTAGGRRAQIQRAMEKIDDIELRKDPHGFESS